MRRAAPGRKGAEGEGSRRGRSGGWAPPALAARELAVKVLVAVDAGARSNEVLPAALTRTRLDARDRSFVTELVYGTLRMRRACDYLVDCFLERPELEPVVRAAARAGAYQLAFMRVPPYAAVSETVSVCPRRARPLLNAVLRRVANLVEAGPVPWPDVATRLSYPDWLVEKLSRDLGTGPALAALEKMNEPASASYRSDGYVQDPGSQAVCEHLVCLLDNYGPSRSGQHGKRLRFGKDVAGAGVGQAEGTGGPVGPGPRVGPVVLDVCSAPGGKATALAAASCLVVAGDLSPARLARVAANVGRLGLRNVVALVMDGVAPALRPSWFDLVLVDAPCSGLGVLRRRPDARWRALPEDIERLAGLQRRLVLAAAPLVAPGGLLAYSVCTLTKEETAGVDEALAGDLAPQTGWEAMAPPAPPWGRLGRGALLLPQAAGTDGMYLLVLRRH
jgi:16S rRNA (cytosine967-C5)-methyltransferase